MDLKGIEISVKEKLENLLLNKVFYNTRMLPEKETQLLAEVLIKEVLVKFNISNFDLTRVRQGNVILISAIRENGNSIVDVMLTIEENLKEKNFNVKYILVTVRGCY